MRLTFDGTAAQIAPIWTPPGLTSPPPRLLASRELAPELECTIINCVRHWAGSRSDIVLELSGGLDSSIVAAAPAAAGADFFCDHLRNARRGWRRAPLRARGRRPLRSLSCGDHARPRRHRPHLRTAADRTKAGGLWGLRRGSISPSNRPCRGSGGSVFGGIGGDNIFDFDGTVASILDAFSHFGVGRRSFASASRRRTGRECDDMGGHASRAPREMGRRTRGMAP